MENNHLNSPENLVNKDTNNIDINPQFDFEKHGIKSDNNIEECSKSGTSPKALNHDLIFERMLDQIKVLNFKKVAGLKEEEPVEDKHLLICACDEILRIAKQNDWGLAIATNYVYIYNGAYWKPVDKKDLQNFLSKAALKMGINRLLSRFFRFRDNLYKQFITQANAPSPIRNEGEVLINLLNGTYVINDEEQFLRTPNQHDFITYQLPFSYNAYAEAPLFQKCLDRVLPDPQLQRILQEFMGYVFTHNLKLEKALFLYGSGANGKSVFFDIINALLGSENISNYSLQSLTNESGYQRAKLADKLINYASEINGKLATDKFKLLVSGEKIEARLPYGEPFLIAKYAKLIFNSNELPKDVEKTHGYFRRFLIVPFKETIPESEQDPTLAMQISKTELAGVFNWVLTGLTRLLKQQKFSESEVVKQQLQEFKNLSDSVVSFLEENDYEISETAHRPLQELFIEYAAYCQINRMIPCSTKTFGTRLREYGYVTKKQNIGLIIYVRKKS